MNIKDTSRVKFSSFSYTILLISIMFIVVACGGSDETEVVTSNDHEGETQLSGLIEIDGSSTVFPITQAVAEEFNKIHSDVQIPVGVSGTGGGMKRLLPEKQVSLMPLGQ